MLAAEIEKLLRKLYLNTLTLAEARRILSYITHLEACLEIVPEEKVTRRHYED